MKKYLINNNMYVKIFLLIIFLFFSSCVEVDCNYYKNIDKKRSYNFIILEKRDRRTARSINLKVKNLQNDKIEIYDCEDPWLTTYYGNLQLNCTIVKKKWDLKMQILKKDTIINSIWSCGPPETEVILR